MNILVLNYEYPPLGGGAAPVSRDISKQLKGVGNNVVLVTMGFGNLPAYEEQDGVKIYRLKCWRKRSDACQPWEQFSYLLAVRKFMKKHVELQDFDVCHTHFVIPTGEVAKFISKKYGIPYVITAHGSDVEGHNQKKSMVIMHRLLRKMWKSIVNNAYCVVAPSIYLENLMRKNNPNGKYVMIPNGINFSKYCSLNNVERKEKRILVMGRLQSFKNVQTILKALSNIDLNGWKVDILGDGPYRQELEKLSIQLNLMDHVTFHGWIENNSQEQMDYLSKASVYISASKFENCPMSVLEAILAGCYPLLSDIPAHRQLIGEGDFYFQYDDEKELSQKIFDVINKKVEKADIDLCKYDWNNIIPQYEKVLREARYNKNNSKK